MTLSSAQIVAPVVGKPMTGIYAFRFAGLDNNGIPMFYDAEDNAVYGMDLSSRDIDALEFMGKELTVAKIYDYVTTNQMSKMEANDLLNYFIESSTVF